MNKLVYDFYLINKNSNLAKSEKIKKLTQLKSPDNKRFLNKNLAKFAVEKLSGNLINHYDNIINNIQNGGSPDKVLQKSMMLNKLKPENLNLLKSNLDSIIKNNVALKNSGPILNTMRNIIDWVFFPLWSIENTPIVGTLVEGPLDSISIILDNTDILMELMGPNIMTAISALLDVGQAVPGAGTAVSAVALPLTILGGPIEHALTDGSDMIGMFFNLSRKQWGMAYISALSAIPMFADIVDSILTNLITANKYLERINKSTDKIEETVETVKTTFDKIEQNIEHFKPIATQILNNPDLLSNPEEFLTKNLLSMKNRVDFLRDLSDEDIRKLIKNARPAINKFKGNPFIYLEDVDKLYDELILPYKNLIPKFRNIPDNKIKEITSGFLNIALMSVNPILNQVANTQQQYIKE